MLVFRVEDMSCGHCVATITGAVQHIDPAARVQADLERHQVRIESAREGTLIEAAIRDAGYTPVPV